MSLILAVSMSFAAVVFFGAWLRERQHHQLTLQALDRLIEDVKSSQGQGLS